MTTALHIPVEVPENEALFRQALDYHFGRNGCEHDFDKAQHLYAKAVCMGNAKAALNLGKMYKSDPTLTDCVRKSLRCMLALFYKAAAMGCADGFFCLHEAYAKGLGVDKCTRTAQRYLQRAAEKGSPLGMTRMGTKLISVGCTTQGLEWLAQALRAGHGDAAYHLASFCYAAHRDIPGMIAYLREGARKGSTRCIRWLAYIYEIGQFGQGADQPYAAKLFQLLQEIDDSDPPRNIRDFDLRYPPKPAHPVAVATRMN